MKANTFHWYKDRLLAMSLHELIWRLILSGKKKLWSIRIPNYSVKTDLSRIPKLNFDDGLLMEEDKLDLHNEAETYLKHNWCFFGLADCNEKFIDWHKDPKSSISAPIKFGFSINHRNEKVVGNIKNTWEKNRHHHLTILAIAYYHTKDEKYAKEVHAQLESWIESNPYLIGVNWTHPLEQGIRLISWVYIYKLLKGSDYFNNIFGKNSFIWKTIYEHQKFIEETYSRGSSANNHLIGEMAGLFISSKIWPIFKESIKWSTLSKKALEEELIEQNYEDGVNKEMGFSYQFFVAQFALLCLQEDDSFSVTFKGMLERMVSFTFNISNVLGSLPNYGDGDEGMALQLNSMKSGQIPWFYQLSNRLLKTNFDLSAMLSQKLKNDCFFVSKESGLIGFSKYVNSHKVGVLFDCGPLGMGSLAAHGHADALSVVLSIDSKEFFIDTGTYCYHDDLKWRAYFRSTKAHNTITINDQDQSKQLGPFLWGHRATSYLDELEESTFSCSAWHDGYSHLGIKHKRSIHLNDSAFLITDRIEGDGSHKIEARFHLHPEVKVLKSESKIQLKRGAINIVFQFDDKLNLFLLEGVDNGGWYSPKFQNKVKCKTIVLEQILSLPIELKSSIEFDKI